MIAVCFASCDNDFLESRPTGKKPRLCDLNKPRETVTPGKYGKPFKSNRSNDYNEYTTSWQLVSIPCLTACFSWDSP